MPDPLGRVAFCVHVLVGVILVGVIGLSGALGPTDLWGVDAWSYWSYDPVHPYAIGVWGTHGAYQYAPPFAQLFMPGQGLPWHAFLAAWTVLLTAVAVWLAGRIGALATLLPPVTRDIWYGNIHLLMGAAVVLGFRRPWTWAFILLTKVTPGIGLLWFVGRRDWRSLGIALGATLAISVVSWALAPWMWTEWVAVLLDLAGRPAPQVAVVGLGPLWLRVALAGVVAFVAGARGLRWPLVVAVVLALPSIWFHSLSMLLAMIPLVLLDRREPLPTTAWRLRRQVPEAGWSVPGGAVREV